jgi:putative membrane-bound dehydrogenase-like protein
MIPGMKFPGLSGAAGLFLGLLIGLLPNGKAASSEPEVDAKDLPRIPPTEPPQAPATFQVKPGFRVELVAAEPLVMDPVAMSFDENGRLYVVEMRDYSERRDERLGRIRVLEDTDGDGRYDKSTVFADDLPWPTAIICYGGGVFVGATPDVYFLKDTNGDGVADVRERVFTGFGAGVSRLNVQELFNSFTWGLDNRIYGANGGNGGSITSPNRPPEKPLELRNRDFSFDPRTRVMRAESGGGQYGMSFDDRGRKFVCSNSSHIRAVMYDERYAGRNPFFTMPPPSLDIAVDGPAAEVYRISPDEPWRVIRTKWRVAGLVPGPIEGGGRPSGYFTGATGITIYRGDAWPEAYRDDAFVADCGSNLVHRKKVYPDGVSYKAERPKDEQKVEFLASRDNWFRPVQMANAPDGNLYVIDMYREVIEHPWSLPESIKKHLDLNSGNDRGRIYRIVPDGFKQPSPPRLGSASTSELAATLEHRNGWHQDTAARLLYERQDASAIPALRRLLASSRVPGARMRALYALAGLRGLEAGDVLKALDDTAGVVRQHGLRLAEEFWTAQPIPADVQRRIERLVTDSDPQVRYQLALTLAFLRPPDEVELLAQLIRQEAADPWMQVAVLNSVGAEAESLFNQLGGDSAFLSAKSHESFLRELMTVIGAKNEPRELDQVFRTVGELKSKTLACSLAASVGAGLQRAGSSISRAMDEARFAPLQHAAEAVLGDNSVPEEARLDAVNLIGQGAFSRERSLLRSLLGPGQPPLLAKAAVRVLGRYPEPQIAEDLLSAWLGLTPNLRGEVVTVLLRRPERVSALLAALESGLIRRADLSASQIDFLRKYSDPVLRQRAMTVLGQTQAGRQEVVKAYAGALALSGNAQNGHEIYLQRCSSCHRLAGQGHALGPDLETVRASGKEFLLTNLLDPNREVMPKYVNYLVETKDGESVTGLVAVENDSSVVLRQPNGNEVTLARSSMASFRSLGQSAMPEGLEEGLKPQDLADLMEYILTAQAP